MIKTIRRATYERNKRTGKYLSIVRETESGAVVVPAEIRGLYENQPNTAMVSIEIEFAEHAEAVRAQIVADEKAKQDAALARLRAKGANV